MIPIWSRQLKRSSSIKVRNYLGPKAPDVQPGRDGESGDDPLAISRFTLQDIFLGDEFESIKAGGLYVGIHGAEVATKSGKRFKLVGTCPICRKPLIEPLYGPGLWQRNAPSPEVGCPYHRRQLGGFETNPHTLEREHQNIDSLMNVKTPFTDVPVEQGQSFPYSRYF